jgi:hypothetical protein
MVRHARLLFGRENGRKTNESRQPNKNPGRDASCDEKNGLDILVSDNISKFCTNNYIIITTKQPGNQAMA